MFDDRFGDVRTEALTEEAKDRDREEEREKDEEYTDGLNALDRESGLDRIIDDAKMDSREEDAIKAGRGILRDNLNDSKEGEFHSPPSKI